METFTASVQIPVKVERLRNKLEDLLGKMSKAVQQREAEIRLLPPDQQMSAINLIEYLTLRSEDIRSLQDELHILGLSSLASSESHIVRQIQAILERLGKSYSKTEISRCDYDRGRKLIKLRSEQLFGEKKDARIPYLMVTFDTEFTDNYRLIKKLLVAGMNVARINCAHDNLEIWENMIGLVRTAIEKEGIPCKVYMDLPGPKMRASILARGRFSGKVRVSEGQEIMLAEREADYDPSDIVIGCDEEGVVSQLQTGNRVLFDDGIIEGKVQAKKDGLAVLKVLRIAKGKPQIKVNAGINFPDTSFQLSSLTQSDRSLLPFICENADLVGYSFLRTKEDLVEFQKELSKFAKRPNVVLKIETAEAVKNFPALLLQGMKENVFGVMIARGDLAVEIGFERLSEIQEEILWISEAAHVPVIWATQVLESLNKSGIATRAEITDASYAAQTECVMLNKGDYIIEGIKTLNDILLRSGGHHVKKRYTFRPMKIAADFFHSNP